MIHPWMKFRMFLTILIFTILYYIPIWGVIYYQDIQYQGNEWILITFHLVPIVFLIYQYFSGTWFALRVINAKECEIPTLNKLNREIANEMNVPEPKLYIGYFGVLNAFAIGRKGNGHVVLSDSLVRELNIDELEVIIAHEISHLQTRDTTLMMIGESIDSLVYRLKVGVAEGIEGIAAAIIIPPVLIVGLIIRAIVLLPLRLISRKREFIADETAGKVTQNPLALASALEKITMINSEVETPENTKAVNSLFITGVKDSLLNRILGTHPSVNKRIEKLQQQSYDRGGYNGRGR